MKRKSQTGTLSEVHAAYTKQRILDAALQLLEESSVSEITVRELSNKARMSERTIFRHFPSREELLDAIATEVGRNLHLPPQPKSVEELLAFPRALYSGFEASMRLTKAALHSELFPRLRDAQAKQRWAAIRKVVDDFAPGSPESARKMAAANIRFLLSASSWQYYRFYFGFRLDEAIACVETGIRDALEGIRQAEARMPKREILRR